MKKATPFQIITILFFCLIIICEIAIGTSFYKAYSKTNKEQALKGTKSTQIFNGEKAPDENDFNVLLIGTDSRGDDAGRSDTLMVAHYDKKNKTPRLISIMRDCYVEIPGYGQDKINAAYSYGGAELLRKTIAKNFDIQIEYYVVVNFSDFSDIIDTLFPKGLEIDAEKHIELDGVTIEKGKQKMDGNTALQYARFRKDDESDFGRVRRQQQVLTAVSTQVNNLTTLTKLPEVAGKLFAYIDTNIPSSLMLSCGTDFISGDTESLETLAIPVENSWEFNDYTDVGSVLMIDCPENAKAMEKFLANK